MPHLSDQIYFENLYCVGQEEIGQAGYLLKDPRSFVMVDMCCFFLSFLFFFGRGWRVQWFEPVVVAHTTFLENLLSQLILFWLF